MKLLKLFEYNCIIGSSEGFAISFQYNINYFCYDVELLLSEENGCIWRHGIIDYSGQYAKIYSERKISSNIKSKLSDNFMYQYQHDRDWKGIPKNFFDTHPNTLPDENEMESELIGDEIFKYFIKSTFEGKI